MGFQYFGYNIWCKHGQKLYFYFVIFELLNYIARYIFCIFLIFYFYPYRKHFIQQYLLVICLICWQILSLLWIITFHVTIYHQPIPAYCLEESYPSLEEQLVSPGGSIICEIQSNTAHSLFSLYLEKCRIANHTFSLSFTWLLRYRKPLINTTLIITTSIITFELFVIMARLAQVQTSVITLKIGACRVKIRPTSEIPVTVKKF